MIAEVGGFIEEKNGSKHLVFNLADENKEILKKFSQLWDGIKNKVETINACKKCEYSNNFIKIKFDTDDGLPLNKALNLYMLTIIVRSVLYSSLFRWVFVQNINARIRKNPYFRRNLY